MTRYTIAALEAQLSRLSTKEEKTSALATFLIDESTEDENSAPIQFLSASTTMQNTYAETQRDAGLAEWKEAFPQVISRHGLDMSEVLAVLMDAPTDSAIPRIGFRLGCASHDVAASQYCKKDGILTCSGCRLVRYCSVTCQKSHWRAHKRDCKHPMNSNSWKPAWEREHRVPAFVDQSAPQCSFGAGMILWGNIPAINIVGPGKFKSRDLGLAFVASGDLRNVVKSVNSLPEDYTGRLTLLLNDHNPGVVARNILILAILGIVEDLSNASEYALHLWYSIFLPSDWTTKAMVHLARHELMCTGLFSGEKINLTPNTTLRLKLSRSYTADIVLEALAMGSSADAVPVSNAFNTVMNAPSRVDYRDRVYARLSPSHRMAILEWRSFGLLMPFGAPNAHLNRANKTLFFEDKCFLGDNVNPLDGWDHDDMVKSGLKHGTTQDDLLGCMYFHVRDELATFARRMRSFKIDIELHDQDAVALSSSIPANVRFDRIEVSNTMDANYLGVAGVLKAWGPRLNDARADATLIGSFMTWALESKKSAKLNISATVDALRNLEASGPASIFRAAMSGSTRSPAALNAHGSLDVFLDHVNNFKDFLKQQGEADASKRAGVKMRSKNKIVPYRLGVPVGADRETLPPIATEDEYYKTTCLSGANHAERFVEWTVV
ncbi:hypothetical protein CYLTODRAFT_491503, partial [Cylindrobasidium torrendii FP15055 ss-10]